VGRPLWLSALVGIALLAGGLLLAFWVFRTPAPGGLTGPTTVVPAATTASPGDAARFVGPPIPHP
jgi:hypothetical protein